MSKSYRCLSLALVLCVPAAGYAAPYAMRLSWLSDPAATLVVSWNDTTAEGQAEVRLAGGGASRAFGAICEGTGATELASVCVAELTGPSPATSYEYRVFSAATWSSWIPARTAPRVGECVPTTFIAGGDSRGEELLGHYLQSPHWPDTMIAMRDERVHFALHDGDFVYTGAVAAQWQEELADISLLASTTPFFLVPGNHDDGPGVGSGAFYNRLFAYPRDNPDATEDYYSLVIGLVHVVGLSSVTFDMAEQVTWLQQELLAHHAEVPWRIVFLHHPIWSNGRHGDGGDVVRPDLLLPVLEALGVDVVVSGHDHHYERFHPSTGGYGDVPRISTPLTLEGGKRGQPNGVVYYVSGGAGAIANPFIVGAEGTAVASDHLHYLLFEATATSLRITTRDLGSQDGEASIEGDLDLIVLDKPGFACAADTDDGGPIDDGANAPADTDDGAPRLDDDPIGGDLDGSGAEPVDDVGPIATGCGCGASRGGSLVAAFAVALGALFVHRRGPAALR